jgi:hypothetical protein
MTFKDMFVLSIYSEILAFKEIGYPYLTSTLPCGLLTYVSFLRILKFVSFCGYSPSNSNGKDSPSAILS